MERNIKIISEKILKTFDELSKNPDMVGMLFSAYDSYDEHFCDRCHAKITAIYRFKENFKIEDPIIYNDLNFSINLVQCDLDDFHTLAYHGDIKDITDLYYSFVIYDCQNDIKDVFETIDMNNHMDEHKKNNLEFQKEISDEIIKLIRRRIPVVIKKDLLDKEGCINCHADDYKMNNFGQYVCINCGTAYLLSAKDIIDDIVNMNGSKDNVYRMYDKKIDNQTNKEEIVDYIFRTPCVDSLKEEFITGHVKRKQDIK